MNGGAEDGDGDALEALLGGFLGAADRGGLRAFAGALLYGVVGYLNVLVDEVADVVFAHDGEHAHDAAGGAYTNFPPLVT